MAFPASPSNNQVHKEGNRSFVYDSTLGVWDQVQETDRLSAEAGGGVLGTVFGGTLGSGTTIGAGVTFPAGHVIKWERTALAADVSVSNSTTATGIFNVTFSPLGGIANNSTIYSAVTLEGYGAHSSAAENRKKTVTIIEGADITNINKTLGEAFGHYSYSGGSQNHWYSTVFSPGVTLDGTGNADIIFTFMMGNTTAHANCSFAIHGDGTDLESHITIWEVV